MSRETEAERGARLIAHQQSLAGEAVTAGMDEAGRGPLAGPVYAACAIMDTDKPINGINDSKKVAEAKRERLAEQIKREAVAYGIGYATVEEIERLNILGATRLAMKRAWEQMAAGDAFLLLDGMDPADIGINGLRVNKGDATCYSIAAASILAKTARDAVMRDIDEKYPAYGFAGHKGYGTKAHIEAIKANGPCPEHRLSFLKNILA